MQIWPAIDLRGGQCVRLQQGDYNRETVFGEDPAAMARHWRDQGAKCLHIVDLDGARGGEVQNWGSIEDIVRAFGGQCELGGGVRDEPTVRRLLGLGVERVVIGTHAIAEPDWFRTMCGKFAGHMVLGIDARDGMVATDGWLKTSAVRATQLASDLARLPLAAIIYTDIATDGMLAGPNVAAVREMQGAVDVPLVASGGVTTLDDVTRLAELGIAGCIIGRALYEGRIDLARAIHAAQAATRDVETRASSRAAKAGPTTSGESKKA